MGVLPLTRKEVKRKERGMNILRKYRKEKRLTQAMLATQAGISLSYYKDIEAGRRNKPSAKILLAIGCALGIESLQGVAELQRSIEKCCDS